MVTNQLRLTESISGLLLTVKPPEAVFSPLFGQEDCLSESFAYREAIVKESFSRVKHPNQNPQAVDLNGDMVIDLYGVDFQEEINVNNILTNVIAPGTDLESIGVPQFNKYIQMLEENVSHIIDMFTRTKEITFAQLLNSGVAAFKDSQNATPHTFSWKRPSASLVDLTSGGYWTSDRTTAVIKAQFNAADNYFITTGEASGEYDVYMGKTQFAALQTTKFYTEEENKRNLRQAVEGSGAAKAGWTHPLSINVDGVWFNIYITRAGTPGALTGGSSREPYFPNNKVIIVPTGKNLGKLMNFPRAQLFSQQKARNAELILATQNLHFWDAPDVKQSTLSYQLAQKWNVVFSGRKAVYTMQISA